MSISLVLTLGHNSSAIVVNDGLIQCGYEEERLSGKKSDSSFPIQAIQECVKRCNTKHFDSLCVGHWFINHELPEQENKYWQPSELAKLGISYDTVYSIDKHFSHHDSHVEAAICFAGKEFTKNCYALVADGFGSSGEVLSIYSIESGDYRLTDRFFGFEKSLGLLYQYATAYIGMKMHNHEYKMLAYEVHVHDLDSYVDVEAIYQRAHDYSTQLLRNMFLGDVKGFTDPVINLEALPEVRAYHDKIFSQLLEEVTGGEELVDYEIRCIISYYVQAVVELTILGLVSVIQPKNLLLCGGLFYNVKLNNLITQLVSTHDGKVCVMPLAGDQGAGLGVYNRYMGDLVWPDNLFWGLRDLTPKTTKGVVVVNNSEDAFKAICKELDRVGFVNFVRGAMEFGPRALCNTTTLALPTKEVAAKINMVNERTNEMPFALVVTNDQAEDLFEGCSEVHKSLEYMICTRDFKPGKHESVLGGAHYYPLVDTFTCRPQITSDPLMCSLLEKYGPLINTSFNFHGVPIVLTDEQILFSHNSQQQHAADIKGVKTVILKGNENE